MIIIKCYSYKYKILIKSLTYEKKINFIIIIIIVIIIIIIIIITSHCDY